MAVLQCLSLKVPHHIIMKSCSMQLTIRTLLTYVDMFLDGPPSCVAKPGPTQALACVTRLVCSLLFGKGKGSGVLTLDNLCRESPDFGLP